MKTSFEDHIAVYEYAAAHDMAYVWEGTRAFEKRKRGLQPEQYQVASVVTRRGPREVLLFSNDVLRAELEADRPAPRCSGPRAGETAGTSERPSRAVR